MNFKNEKHTNYSFENYDKLVNLLWDKDNFINAANLNSEIVQIDKLIFIKHNVASPMFHMFPQNIVNIVFNKINKTNIIYNKNVFITRGTALHLPRNLNNQIDIEHYFMGINYSVINPELLNIETFINAIKDATNVYITWGGAMVNLCYVNPNSNIYILKSQSYMNEDIFTIFKFLKTYKNIHIIKCDNNNNIDMNACIITKL
jgi:capsular polysaccharide biosynthesis protein